MPSFFFQGGESLMGGDDLNCLMGVVSIISFLLIVLIHIFIIYKPRIFCFLNKYNKMQSSVWWDIGRHHLNTLCVSFMVNFVGDIWSLFEFFKGCWHYYIDAHIIYKWHCADWPVGLVEQFCSYTSSSDLIIPSSWRSFSKHIETANGRTRNVRIM
jgi:hypothetical protein